MRPHSVRSTECSRVMRELRENQQTELEKFDAETTEARATMLARHEDNLKVTEAPFIQEELAVVAAFHESVTAAFHAALAEFRETGTRGAARKIIDVYREFDARCEVELGKSLSIYFIDEGIVTHAANHHRWLTYFICDLIVQEQPSARGAFATPDNWSAGITGGISNFEAKAFSALVNGDAITLAAVLPQVEVWAANTARKAGVESSANDMFQRVPKSLRKKRRVGEGRVGEGRVGGWA